MAGQPVLPVLRVTADQVLEEVPLDWGGVIGQYNRELRELPLEWERNPAADEVEAQRREDMRILLNRQPSDDEEEEEAQPFPPLTPAPPPAPQQQHITPEQPGKEEEEEQPVLQPHHEPADSESGDGGSGMHPTEQGEQAPEPGQAGRPVQLEQQLAALQLSPMADAAAAGQSATEDTGGHA